MRAISCQTCHEPHGETIPTNNPHLLRTLAAVTMPDGTVVTNAGEGALCLQCHQNRNGSATNQLVNYPLGQNTWSGGSSFGAHDNPQGDMIEGINAITYGQTIPSSAHRYSVTNLCVGCHMQTVASTDPGFLQAGGHTFNMSYKCRHQRRDEHGRQGGRLHPMPRPDHLVQLPVRGFRTAIGVIEGVQTEVQNLLNKLSTLLPNSTYQANGNIRGGWPGEDQPLGQDELAAEVPEGRLQLAVCQQ